MRLVPNIISLLRVLSVPLIVVLLVSGEWAAAFWVFLGAGVSDALDGFLARHFDARTEVGTYLDPIADKALLVSVYVTLVVLDLVPSWLVILVVSRDLLIVGGILFSFAISLPLKVRPSLLSKVNTFAQIAFAVAVLGVHGMNWQITAQLEVATYVVGLLTALSGGQYVMQWAQAAFGANHRIES